MATDPILQHEKFTNKFKIAVGDGCDKKLGVEKWKI